MRFGVVAPRQRGPSPAGLLRDWLSLRGEVDWFCLNDARIGPVGGPLLPLWDWLVGLDAVIWFTVPDPLSLQYARSVNVRSTLVVDRAPRPDVVAAAAEADDVVVMPWVDCRYFHVLRTAPVVRWAAPREAGGHSRDCRRGSVHVVGPGRRYERLGVQLVRQLLDHGLSPRLVRGRWSRAASRRLGRMGVGDAAWDDDERRGMTRSAITVVCVARDRFLFSALAARSAGSVPVVVDAQAAGDVTDGGRSGVTVGADRGPEAYVACCHLLHQPDFLERLATASARCLASRRRCWEAHWERWFDRLLAL